MNKLKILENHRGVRKTLIYFLYIEMSKLYKNFKKYID